MTEKTDASELAPEVDADEITRARFTALRDQLLTSAESFVSTDRTSTDSVDTMVAVAHMVTAAAQANHSLAMHSINELEKQKHAEINEYFQNFIGMMKAMEASNDQRFEKQKEWVERELKARGMPPPKEGKVLSLVPHDGRPEPDPVPAG